MTEELPERAAAAVIRAWIEPGANGLRVRVTETVDLAEPEARVNPVVSSIDETCDIVRRWLTRVLEGPPRGPGGVEPALRPQDPEPRAGP